MMDEPARVLVLDADGQAGLSLVRSLSRQGVSVTAGSSNRLSLGRLSRHSDTAYLYPEPAESADRFVDHLINYLHATEHAMVIPVRDKTSTILSAHKTDIEKTEATVAIEDWETYERVYDKGQLFDIVESLPVPSPETYQPESLADVTEIGAEMSYPAVVKPRSKTVWDAGEQCHYTRVDDSHYVSSPDELVVSYRDLLGQNPVLEAQDHYPLIQEYVPGTTTTTVVLADEGTMLADFQEERIRTYPSSGGNSTLLRGVAEPQMRVYAKRVIEALEWTGPAMVEFMRTPDDEFYLIEVNGRYWGSVPFALESGVDFPWLHYQLLQGVTIDESSSYRTDFRQQRLINEDLKWLLEQLQKGNPTELLAFLWTCLTAKQTFVSLSDPMPTVVAPCQTVSLGGRALAQKVIAATPQLDVLVREYERS